jgi:hypothetical protein
MKTKFPVIIFSSLVICLFTTCFIPTSKESYLKNFERFVSDVEKNGEKFTVSDWRWANKRFSKYCGEWFENFRNDLKMEEKIKVTGLKTRYTIAKSSSRIGQLMDNDLGKDLERVTDDVKEYMKKDFSKDIQEISKGAREIGDSALKVIEDVKKEVKKKD